MWLQQLPSFQTMDPAFLSHLTWLDTLRHKMFLVGEYLSRLIMLKTTKKIEVLKYFYDQI
jgi:hypothetical protein